MEERKMPGKLQLAVLTTRKLKIGCIQVHQLLIERLSEQFHFPLFISHFSFAIGSNRRICDNDK
jgi:hypothetical protein